MPHHTRSHGAPDPDEELDQDEEQLDDEPGDVDELLEVVSTAEANKERLTREIAQGMRKLATLRKGTVAYSRLARTITSMEQAEAEAADTIDAYGAELDAVRAEEEEEVRAELNASTFKELQETMSRAMSSDSPALRAHATRKFLEHLGQEAGREPRRVSKKTLDAKRAAGGYGI